MVEVLSSVNRVARKDHEDSAGVWISNCLFDIRSCGELTFTEWRAIAKLRANGWMIKKGQPYNDAVCKQDGELYSFKSIPEVNAICQKLGLYDGC